LFTKSLSLAAPQDVAKFIAVIATILVTLLSSLS
jgi:hypothetical protein